MRFSEPLYLLLLIPIAGGLWLSWRHIFGMARPRKRLAFVVRSVLCACLVLAMSGPQIHRINSGTATMFIIDGSDSVSESDHKEAEQYISRAMLALGPEDVAGVVSFGAQPVLDSVPAGRRPFTGVQSKLDRSASDLAAAIRLASATLPTNKGRRIVVLSDGNETRGDVRQSAEASLNEGIELDIVPLGSKPRQAEASVIEMRAPNESRAGQPFGVRVVLESTVQQEATIIVDRNGTVVSRQRVQLDEGKTSYVLDQKLDGPGYYRFRATLQAQRDSDSRNNVGSTFTAVRGKPKVLVLQSDRVPGPLVLALRSQDITVDVFGPEGVPVRPEELQNYEAVFLNDINAQFVTPNQMKILAAAARDTGIGLVMVGGENSYLPGGWYGTPVADALPVDLNIRQRKSYPSTSVLVIADASGSMGMIEDGLQKIQLAAKAAEETVKLMSPIDRVGVAGSSDGIEFVAPLQDLKDKDSVISQIRKLRTGGGGIYSSPSIHFADSKLRAENSKVRHLVLLADGADVDDYGDSINVVSRMKADKITTSVVAIGDGKDVPFLRALAAAGGGNFYLANKASKLPAIFTQDVAIMSRSAIEELVFVPEMKGGEEALRGFSPSDFPALSAYCLADSRPLARVGLVSPKKDPVLASWQYGLATTVAFMSDAQPRWASRWVGWGGFPVFWAQVARTVTRKATNNDYRLVVEPSGGQAVLKLTAMDRLGQPLSQGDVTVRVSSPTGESSEISLMQEAPGQFTGLFPAAELGSYVLSVSEAHSTERAGVATSGFSVAYPPEYRKYSTNRPLLSSIAEITGGRVLDIAKPYVGTQLRNPGETVVELWPWLVGAASVVLLFDVAVRRLAVKFFALLAQLWAKATGRQVSNEVQAPAGRLSRANLSQSSKPSVASSPSQAPRQPGQAGPVENSVTKATPSSHVSAATKLLQKRKMQDSEDDSAG